MKKVYEIRKWLSLLSGLSQFFRVMKLTVIFLMVVSLSIYAKGFSQSITYNGKNVPLEKVLQVFQKQTGYAFFYNDAVLKNTSAVSLNVENEDWALALNTLLKNNGLGYNKQGETIFIYKKEEKAHPSVSVIRSAPPVEGVVVDSLTGEPLVGVTVRIKGTTRGTTTDENGAFSLDVPQPDADTLVFTYIGYDNKKVVVNGRSTLNIQLSSSSHTLNDIVVVGYGTQRKVSLTGGVDVIKPETMEGRAVTNVSQALQGTSPGLVIQQKSFEPGQPVNINLRGIGTLGDNTPLVVIDGLVGGDMNSLNPNDIASISVLKDAGAAAIYGSRSANGVILITTKKGQKGTGKVTYNGIMSVINPHFWVKPVPGYQNMMMKNQALINAGQTPVYSPLEIQQQKDRGDEEWILDAIFHNAIQQNHNLSISGGSENLTYRLSGGYMDQESNFVGPDKGVKRYNLRMNLSSEVGRLKVSGILAYTRNEIKDHSYSTGTLVVDAERTPPMYRLRDSLGRYLINPVLAEFNPLGILEKGGFRNYDNDNLFGTLTGELSITDGLSLKGVFGGSLDANHEYYRTNYVPFYRSGTAPDGDPAGVYGNSKGTTTGDNNSKNILLNTQLLLQYEKTIQRHHFLVMGGVTTESHTFKSNHVALDYTSPDLNLPNSNTIADVGDQQITPQGTSESALNSYIGRATYSYSDKYFGELAFRADGSSKFSKDHRWGFFPSISGGWLLSREPFFEDGKISDFFDELKLRVSYGVLGNQNVGNYQYQTTYFVFSNAYGFNNKSVAGTGFTTANPDIRWETAHTFNLGTDIGLFDHRLNISFDYFNKLTKDILQQPNLPGTYGGSDVDFNIASVRNQGWELTINYDIEGPEFRHNLSFNIGDTRNEIVRMANDQDRLQSLEELQVIYAKGIPIASYVGLKRDGYFQNLEDVKNKPTFVGLQVRPGDISYKDKNGDGVIDDNDRYILGNPFPRYTFGLNYTLGWNNFDLSLFIQGVGKRDMALRGELIEPFHMNYSYVMFQHQMDYWRPDNMYAKYPLLASTSSAPNTNNFRKGSDLYIFNGAYARLKNLQIGYTLPQELSGKIGLEQLRVYLTGQNLFTLAKTNFVDPETTEFNNDLDASGANSGRNYPTLIYYGFGLDVTFK